MVVAIIGLLAALLLPALKNARERAQAAVCTSSVRQLGISILMYADDFNSYPPQDKSFGWPNPPYVGGIQIWTATLRVNRYVKDSLSGAAAYDYSVLTSPFMCPTAKLRNYTHMYSTHIGINAAISMDGWDFGAGNMLNWTPFKKFTAPARTYLLADSIIPGYLPELRTCNDFVPGMLDPTLDLRHRGRATLSFADGHVEFVDRWLNNNSYLTTVEWRGY